MLFQFFQTLFRLDSFKPLTLRKPQLSHNMHLSHTNLTYIIPQPQYLILILKTKVKMKCVVVGLRFLTEPKNLVFG